MCQEFITGTPPDEAPTRTLALRGRGTVRQLPVCLWLQARGLPVGPEHEVLLSREVV
jgi:hypothetical protein